MGEIELDAERQMMDRFLSELVRTHPKATYGEVMIRNALQQGAVDTLLISESMRKNSVEIQCGSCDHIWTASVGRTEQLPVCPTCEASNDSHKELSSSSLIDVLSDLASKSNSEVVFISIDTEEGSQLALGFGGLAAILRYPMM
jgi:peptide chain release factor subunit 1